MKKENLVPVRVGAIFERGQIRPVWFVIGHQKMDVKRVTYRWKDMVGSVAFIHFSVDSGGEIHELVCRSDTFEWFLLQEG